MELNFVNKVYIGVAILMVIAIIYKNVAYKSWERYNYSASINAPATFPVHVKEAYFILPNEDMESISTEDVNNFNTEWAADYGTIDHTKLTRLPEELMLKYVSFRDKKFYKDTLKLPQAKLKLIFEKASRSRQFLTLSSYAGTKKGLNFVIGLANDGQVIVWLRGVNLEEIVLKTKLKAKIPDSDDTYYGKPLSKEAYFNLVFEDLTDSIKTRLNNGFDMNANYIDTPTNYLKKNQELWEYQKKNGFID